MVVTRFAPSPTGYLHIGGLRTALYSYLHARRHGGKFLLRVEDTDLSRNKEEATQAILEAFAWCGLSYDEEVLYQSNRFALYKEYIDRLLSENKAYYCYMSKEELDALREEQMQRKERPRYDNRYRDYTGEIPAGIEPVVRIKAPLEGTITIKDGIKGDITISADEVDDFIIARSDGTPTYNFVVAIDDALMGMSDVIRGDDHLYNTPKQMVVYEALGFAIPNYYHVPMINNEKGKKLSKRDGAVDVMEYKRMGYLPEALLNFLVRLGWSHNDQEIFSMEEMMALFDPNSINKSASSYNTSKLDWLNSHYINSTSNERLIALLKEFGANLEEHPKRDVIIDAIKERAKTLVELATLVNEIIVTPTAYDEKASKKALKGEALVILADFKTALMSYEGDYHKLLEEFVAQKEIGFGKIGQPLRLALFGKLAGIELDKMMSILGKEESIKRIDNLIDANA